MLFGDPLSASRTSMTNEKSLGMSLVVFAEHATSNTTPAIKEMQEIILALAGNILI
jgi:hypothetical protein